MRSKTAALIALAAAWSQITWAPFAWAPSAWAQAPAPANDIDLKLFDKAEIDRSRGCSLALWQANRDPETDRFAIVFSEQFRGADHVREAARIKIGNAVVPLQRIATGGKSEGYDLYPFQLYKMPDEQGYVVLDLKLEPEMGEAVEISSGKLMVTMLGKQAFRASVKGGAGCNGAPLPGPAVAAQSPASVASGAVTAGTLSAGPAPGGALQASSVPGTRNAPSNPQPQAPARADLPVLFERYVPRPQQVPARFLARLNQRFGCTIQTQRAGIVGFQMSEESAIWQIPCDQFGSRVTSIFALVYLSAPDSQFEVLETPVPRGRERKLDSGVLMSAQWDIRSRTVTSLYPLSDKGDCGVFERFGITPEGKFTLVEFREKATCDGQMTRPEQWPAIVGRR
jgi:hypothetical protein